MDEDDGNFALKQQVEQLKRNVAATRTELRAFRIVFTIVLDALRDENPAVADSIMSLLQTELNKMRSMGDSDLFRALDHIHQKSLPKET